MANWWEDLQGASSGGTSYGSGGGYTPGAGGYAVPQQNQNRAIDDGSGDDGSEDGMGPSEEKKACHASGGTWQATGPYGQGYCKPKTGEGGNPYGCQGDDVKINLDAQGKPGPEVCVSQAEASRRNQLWISANPGNAAEGSGSGSSSSSSGGTTVKPPTFTKSPYDAKTAEAIYNMLMGIMNGKDLPFGPDTVARMQAAALQSNKGQLGNAQMDAQKRLINSGLSRSGAAPDTYAKLSSAANVDLSNNLRTIATTAVQENYSARMSALDKAQEFLQSERANSLSQDQLILSYARLAQEKKMQEAQLAQNWAIVQNGNEQEMIKLMLCLRTGVC